MRLYGAMSTTCRTTNFFLQPIYHQILELNTGEKELGKRRAKNVLGLTSTKDSIFQSRVRLGDHLL